MQHIIKNKKIFYATLSVLIVGFAFAVPMFKHKTIAYHIKAALTTNNEKNEDENVLLAEDISLESNKDIVGIPVEQALQEFEKLQLLNSADDTLTMSGTIKVYDNLNDKGINDVQKFTLQQMGNYGLFTVDSFDRVYLPNTMVMVDHVQKIIGVQTAKKQDSAVANLAKNLNKKDLEKMIKTDGVKITIETEGEYKVMNIYPNISDPMNQYSIYYSPTTYEIKKYKMYYSSYPYENDENLNDESVILDENSFSTNDSAVIENKSKFSELDDMTEYVVEYNIEKTVKKCNFNFKHNNLFTISKNNEIKFDERLKEYEKSEF